MVILTLHYNNLSVVYPSTDLNKIYETTRKAYSIKQKKTELWVNKQKSTSEVNTIRLYFFVCCCPSFWEVGRKKYSLERNKNQTIEQKVFFMILTKLKSFKGIINKGFHIINTLKGIVIIVYLCIACIYRWLILITS